MELRRRGFTFSSTLWSGEAILSQPEQLIDIHRAYLAAGAQVIETATYQVSHEALRALGYDSATIDGVFARAVRVARDAIGAHQRASGSTGPYLVAGSLGPYGATRGDGSEYSGTQHLERDALYRFHAERARSMARAKPDVFLFETIPSRAEVLVIADVARDLGLERVWISLSCRDGMSTWAGDSVREIAADLDACAWVDVVGVNCVAPTAVASLVRELAAGTAKPILVCPNLGQHWETETQTLAGGTSEAQLTRHVPDWLALGVMYVGGCCGVGPQTIGAIAAAVMDRR